MGIKFDRMSDRKNVVRYQTQTVVEPVIIKPVDKYKIITDEVYTTGDEEFLIVKEVEHSTITLNSELSPKITIKSLTTVLIKSDVGLIDEDWDELLLEKGACVKFRFVGGNWYVTSSDGLKTE